MSKQAAFLTFGTLIALALALVIVAMVVSGSPCVTEDSTMCTWNAQDRGNGLGVSFVNLFGLTIYRS